jgi:UrcA family protein
MRKTSLFLAASAGLVFASPAVQAQPPVHTTPLANEVVVTAPSVVTSSEKERKHQTVKYADLNIQTADGAKAMVRRLNSAAEKVCMPYPKKDLKDTKNHQNCVSGAMEGAVASLGSPAVQQAYNDSK